MTPCVKRWGVIGGSAGVSEWLEAAEVEMVVGVMKLGKHVEIDVTARQIKTLPDAQALSGQGPQQSHPPVGRDSPGRRAKRCQMWRKPPGPSRQACLTLSRLCYSICFQSRVKNAGTSTCQKSFKHSPAVSL